jgi:hypothetical protein
MNFKKKKKSLALYNTLKPNTKLEKVEDIKKSPTVQSPLTPT